MKTTKQTLIAEFREKFGNNQKGNPLAGKGLIRLAFLKEYEDWLFKAFDQLAQQTREEIGKSIPLQFIIWRKYVDEFWKSESRETRIVLDFPTWLHDQLSQRERNK